MSAADILSLVKDVVLTCSGVIGAYVALKGKVTFGSHCIY